MDALISKITNIIIDHGGVVTPHGPDRLGFELEQDVDRCKEKIMASIGQRKSLIITITEMHRGAFEVKLLFVNIKL